MELAIEAGADDVKPAGDRWEVICEPSAMADVIAAIQGAGMTIESNEIVRIPTNSVDVDDVDTARRVLHLMERLDDHDDVQNVYGNHELSDALMAKLAG